MGAITGLQTRSNHAAAFTDRLGNEGTVCLVGGVQYTGHTPSNRLPISQIDLIHIESTSERKFATERVLLDVPLHDIIYLSSCDTTIIGNELFAFGGAYQKVPEIDPNQFDEPSDSMFKIDLETHSIHTYHGNTPGLFSAGGTILPIAQDTILISGGTSSQFSVFTSRQVESQTCAMEEECHVNDHDNNEEEIRWVQCSKRKCGKWYHLFCVGLEDDPADDYYCPRCDT